MSIGRVSLTRDHYSPQPLRRDLLPVDGDDLHGNRDSLQVRGTRIRGACVAGRARDAGNDLIRLCKGGDARGFVNTFASVGVVDSHRSRPVDADSHLRSEAVVAAML